MLGRLPSWWPLAGLALGGAMALTGVALLASGTKVATNPRGGLWVVRWDGHGGAPRVKSYRDEGRARAFAADLMSDPHADARNVRVVTMTQAKLDALAKRMGLS
jgi:hypothetical protein